LFCGKSDDSADLLFQKEENDGKDNEDEEHEKVQNGAALARLNGDFG